MPRNPSSSSRPFGPLRRLFQRGWNVTRHELRTLPRIAAWTWSFWNEPPQTIPVHVLTGKDDWRLAAWMLASWFHFSEYAWPVVIHDDGTLPADAHTTLRKLFGDVRIIVRSEADRVLTPALRAYPFCADYREKHVLALKLFDIPHFAQGDRFLVFDSDLLFFSYPREILEWTRTGGDEIWFSEDLQENALITAAEVRAELGIKLWPRVNTGLSLLTKSIIDLDLCDRALALTSVLSGDHSRIEQTLLMLCAARHGKGGLLPRTYEVSAGKSAAPDVIARHYTGAARDQFYAEGLPRLAPVLFPTEDA